MKKKKKPIAFKRLFMFIIVKICWIRFKLWIQSNLHTVLKWVSRVCPVFWLNSCAYAPMCKIIMKIISQIVFRWWQTMRNQWNSLSSTSWAASRPSLCRSIRWSPHTESAWTSWDRLHHAIRTINAPLDFFVVRAPSQRPLLWQSGLMSPIAKFHPN